MTSAWFVEVKPAPVSGWLALEDLFPDADVDEGGGWITLRAAEDARARARLYVPEDMPMRIARRDFSVVSSDCPSCGHCDA